MSDDQQIRVLLVEDHPLTRIGLRAILPKHDPAINIVGEATDGEQAVEKVQELQPDVVLMDLGLTRKDGAEATAAIKEIMPGIQIVIFSSHDQDTHVFKALSAGANGYCLKTISGQGLALAVRAVFSGACWLDPSIAGRVFQACATEKTQEAPKAKVSHTAPYALSEREQEVLNLVVEGLSNQQIARQLVVSQETVKTHVRHIMEKLVVSDRTQAAVKAVREGLVNQQAHARNSHQRLAGN